MGFFSEFIGSVVNVALTPIAVVKDVVNVATGEDASATKKQIEKVVEGVSDSIENLMDGDL